MNTNTQKMTIHRALAELKLIDSKINKGIEEFLPVGIYQPGSLANGQVQIDAFNTAAQSTHDSVVALIDRKSKIKSAIVRSNSTTSVKIGNVHMTVADAITTKATIDFKKKLITRMKRVRDHAKSEMNKNNDVVQVNKQKLLEATLGKDNVKPGAGDVEAIEKPYLERNLFTLLDPLKIDERISALEKEVEVFEAEVDATLSETNAITFIEV